jgi:HEAT repeat protein
MLEGTNDNNIKMHAVDALVKASPGQALKPLIAALDDPSRMVRVAAASGLADLGDPAAISAMESAKRRAWNPLLRLALWLDIDRLRKQEKTGGGEPTAR